MLNNLAVVSKNHSVTLVTAIPVRSCLQHVLMVKIFLLLYMGTAWCECDIMEMQAPRVKSLLVKKSESNWQVTKQLASLKAIAMGKSLNVTGQSITLGGHI